MYTDSGPLLLSKEPAAWGGG